MRSHTCQSLTIRANHTDALKLRDRRFARSLFRLAVRNTAAGRRYERLFNNNLLTTSGDAEHARLQWDRTMYVPKSCPLRDIFRTHEQGSTGARQLVRRVSSNTSALAGNDDTLLTKPDSGNLPAARM